jgi:hypothetical protein
MCNECGEEYAAELEAAEAAPAPRGGWQDIASAPEAERVWVWIPNAGAQIALKTTHPSDGAVWWNGEERVYNPTLWQPLPAPPPSTERREP